MDFLDSSYQPPVGNPLQPQSQSQPAPQPQQPQPSQQPQQPQQEQQDDPVLTLCVMFCEQGWDRASLEEIYRSNNNDLAATIDEVLAAGSCENWIVQRLGASIGTTQMPTKEMAKVTKWKFVTVVAPPTSTPGSMLEINDAGKTFVVQIPPGIKPGKRFRAKVPDFSGSTAAQGPVQVVETVEHNPLARG